MSMSKDNFKSENTIKQMYFTSLEIAEMIHETVATVRYWVLVFNIYRKGGVKSWLYPRESVAKLHMIKQLLRVSKYSTEGAKLQLQKMIFSNNVKITTYETQAHRPSNDDEARNEPPKIQGSKF